MHYYVLFNPQAALGHLYDIFESLYVTNWYIVQYQSIGYLDLALWSPVRSHSSTDQLKHITINANLFEKCIEIKGNYLNEFKSINTFIYQVFKKNLIKKKMLCSINFLMIYIIVILWSWLNAQLSVKRVKSPIQLFRIAKRLSYRFLANILIIFKLNPKLLTRSTNESVNWGRCLCGNLQEGYG